MKLHFFTVRDLEDYRKYYSGVPWMKKALAKEANARTAEEYDQGFFFRAMKPPFVPDGIFESKIFYETGIDGLRLDFNFGLRLDIPEGNFRVKVSDFDSGDIFFDKYISGGRLLSVERFFIRWHVEIFLDDEKVFTHTLNLEGKSVAIYFIRPLLGDTLSFLPYLSEFQKIHRCELKICPPGYLRELISKLYPNLPLVDEIKSKTYATYYLATVISPTPNEPVDTRRMSFARMGGVLLGIDYIPPKAIFKPTAPPVTNEPYVCISVQASQARKCWHYPGGWDIVVSYLKSLGYRVFCIDRNAKEVNDGFTICKPDGAEDFTGNRPLLERANMLYHAQFFIGLSSGLSWIADAVDCPVVMIAGFTLDWHEFYTPYRVANRKVCNGCFNDERVIYLADRCPYHKKTPREFECHKKISPRMVINAIERLIVNKNLKPPALKNF